LQTQQLASAQRQEALLAKLADDKNVTEVKIKGSDLIILIRKIERETGRKLLVDGA
jgi:hypothetical protein